MKPASLAKELSEERIAETGAGAMELLDDWSGNPETRRCAMTTLALIAERAEMLRMLEQLHLKCQQNYPPTPWRNTVLEIKDTIATFLATRTAAKETR